MRPAVPEPGRRRVPRRNRRRYWLKLLLEFLAVVLGVTVSLLVDEWRKDREAREEENIALAELRADIIADYVEIRSDQRVLLWQYEALQRIRNWNPETDPGDSLPVFFRRAIIRKHFIPNRSAYMSLEATGKINLILDDVLRLGLKHLFDQGFGSITWFEDYAQLDRESNPILERAVDQANLMPDLPNRPDRGVNADFYPHDSLIRRVRMPNPSQDIRGACGRQIVICYQRIRNIDLVCQMIRPLAIQLNSASIDWQKLDAVNAANDSLFVRPR